MKLSTRRASRSAGANGGFPEPAPGERVRVIRRPHARCGSEVRVRVPARLPEQSVRRVLCERCDERFDVTPADAVGRAATAPRGPLDALRGRLPVGLPTTDRLPALPRPRLPQIPRSRLWAWASVPLALAGGIVGLSLIQGSDSESAPAAAESAVGDGAPRAKFIQQPGYSLALPAGWTRVEPPKGAAFAAASESGDADATLWITRDPDLSFRRFEKRSLEQLGGLADNARVVDRVNGPTVESSIVELRADAPLGEAASVPYRVTLRAAGPWRLYFATTTQPGAPAKRLAQAEQMHGSLRPEVVGPGES
jgi:hypothetical protein